MRQHIPIKLQEFPELDEERHVEKSLEESAPECVLRFPFFDKEWNGGSIDFYESEAFDHFPEMHKVQSMLATEDYNNFPMSPGDCHFWEMLKSCSASEIYFLDSYFSAANLARLLDIIDYMDCQIDRATTHIVIYTCARDEWKALKSEFEKQNDQYARLEKMTLTICCIDKTMSLKMHDRFALLGKSLWHFGASAGAMHTDINAYSGPWSDKDGKCMEFMRSLREHHVVEAVSTIRRRMKQ